MHCVLLIKWNSEKEFSAGGPSNSSGLSSSGPTGLAANDDSSAREDLGGS